MNHNNSISPVKGLQNFMDDIFNNSMSEILGTPFKTNQASVNISESDNDYHFQFAAPGLTKKDFNIEVHKRVLTVSTSINADQETVIEGMKRQEFGFSQFKRSFHLPELADEESINAKYKNGIIEVTISKKEKVEDVATKIEIS